MGYLQASFVCNQSCLETINVEVVQIQYKYLYQLLRAIRFRQMYPYWDFQVYVLLYSFFFRGSRCPIIFMLMIFFILGPCSHWFVLRWFKNEKEITHKKPYQSKDSSETVYFQEWLPPESESISLVLKSQTFLASSESSASDDGLATLQSVKYSPVTPATWGFNAK